DGGGTRTVALEKCGPAIDPEVAALFVGAVARDAGPLEQRLDLFGEIDLLRRRRRPEGWMRVTSLMHARIPRPPAIHHAAGRAHTARGPPSPIQIEPGQLLADGSQVPDAHVAVGAADREALAVLAPGDPPHGAHVLGQRQELLAGRDVPHARAPARRRGD